MKNKPKLEEVKEYFKNAEEVESPVSSFDGKIKLKTIRWYDKKEKHIVCDCNNAVGLITLWSYDKGCSKILTYKEKTFTITESQIKGLSEEIKISPESAILYLKEKLFPEAFKSEVKMEIGKWYKQLNFGKFMFCFNGKIEYYSQYGFNYAGEWSEQLGIKEGLIVSYVEATESEVFEALKNEAVKRGYKEGVCLKTFISDFYIMSYSKIEKSKEYYNCEEGKFDKNALRMGGCCIYSSGKWAKIIPTITKSEAEKQLNKKIID